MTDRLKNKIKKELKKSKEFMIDTKEYVDEEDIKNLLAELNITAEVRIDENDYHDRKKNNYTLDFQESNEIIITREYWPCWAR